ncbi:hypothetical protein [Micromonospora echinospora]|uniref:hypothetical protein n=1 Tax=Micromonospora echinospora TaxID=1877 RepID=UPI003A8B71D3
MTGVELIVAALAAGAGAGTSAAAVDAYVGLRDALRRRLAGRGQAEQILHEDAGSTVWEQRIAMELADSGADRDELVLGRRQPSPRPGGPRPLSDRWAHGESARGAGCAGR